MVRLGQSGTLVKRPVCRIDPIGSYYVLGGQCPKSATDSSLIAEVYHSSHSTVPGICLPENGIPKESRTPKPEGNTSSTLYVMNRPLKPHLEIY
ncbi:hypothetical protein AVEN_27219-1 [Araneus ventricosus]|uniref:Uncharacterized protein n=1 Tax=Araneus ventricosus TaxID=182803 RepID=A0A4Y2CBK3_ARAVE|nr:hypothetical protein AVEN_27219-1 [Araneus ventricosus]